MKDEAAQFTNSLQAIRRLLARESASDNAGAPEVAGADLQRACLRVSRNLRDSIGETGCDSLLARAIARTESDHPALTIMIRRDDASIHLDRVAAGVEAHGVAAATASLEALLAALLDILARLIGEDMALQLIDQGPESRMSDGAAP